jgi:uncharacterized protein YbjQ (UPF0145 family)
MITTTLAELPGRRPYEVVGVVIGIARDLNAQKTARRQMEALAEDMGADAISDVHLQMEALSVPGAQAGLIIALIGTAIKFIQRHAPTP